MGTGSLGVPSPHTWRFEDNMGKSYVRGCGGASQFRLPAVSGAL